MIICDVELKRSGQMEVEVKQFLQSYVMRRSALTRHLRFGPCPSDLANAGKGI